jgi:allophanate hydrolase subunit 1
MDIADIMIHIHPELSEQQRKNIETLVSEHEGVVSIHFSPQHLQELTVAYDPAVISAEQVLTQVRRWDEAAVMAGL